MHPVAKSLGVISDELNATFFERRASIEAGMLALMAGQHVFVLGPPGSAKTDQYTNLINRFVGARTFECLLSRTRPDAAILGPYNLPELREQGSFTRKSNGFLQTADLAILDEIGKMSPVLGHDLLAIMNERVYHEVNGGRSKTRVPLSTAFTASNELITNDSEDAAAMWDRLLVRTWVDYIQTDGHFLELMATAVDTGTPVSATTIEWAQVAAAINDVVPRIPVTKDAWDAMLRLRALLRAAQIRPSDRRFKQSVRVMQANAFLAGRDRVTDEDAAVLRYTLWDTPEQIKPVERMALSVADPDAKAILDITDQLDEFATGIASRRGEAIEARAAFGTEIAGKVRVLKSELDTLRTKIVAAGRKTDRVEEASTRLEAVREAIFTELLELPRRGN